MMNFPFQVKGGRGTAFLNTVLFFKNTYINYSACTLYK